jgi:hypothetical protein
MKKISFTVAVFSLAVFFSVSAFSQAAPASAPGESINNGSKNPEKIETGGGDAITPASPGNENLNSKNRGNSGNDLPSAPSNANKEKNNLKNQGEDQNVQIQIQENKPVSENSKGRGNSGKAEEALKQARQKIQTKLSGSEGNKARLHQAISQEVGQRLMQAVEGEKQQVRNKIHQVAQEQQKQGEEIAEAVGKVERRGRVSKFIIGSDYKNLGQLRSEITQNENQIRQLTQALSGIENEENRQVIQEQIALLAEEREQLKSFVKENEDNFSLFGWAFRMINGYEKDAIDEQEEQELQKEVEEALNNESDENDIEAEEKNDPQEETN